MGATFAIRSRDLYAGFLHACAGSSVITPLVLARPLIELTILIRWIRDDVDGRVELWQAHSAEMDAKAIRQTAEHLPRPAGDPYNIDELAQVLASKDAAAAAGRAAARRSTADRVLPGLVEMVQSIEKLSKDEGHALWQAYDLAFRFVSPATHSDDASFKLNFDRTADGTMEYAERSIIEPDHLRLIVAGCMAHTIETAARMCRLDDMAETALSIRIMLVRSTDA